MQPDGGPPGDPLPPKRLSIAVPLVLAGLGLGVGLSHLYVRKRTVGLILIAIWTMSLVALFSGVYFGLWTMITVWVADLVGGIMGVRSYNRLLDEATAARHRSVVDAKQRPQYLN